MKRSERMMARLTGRRGERALAGAALAGLAASAGLSLLVAPPDAIQGEVQRLMYVHVPAAWLAYLSFTVVFAASVAYLVTSRTRWDRLAAASAEVGVLFCALTIVLGALWGRPVWGTWWTWDPRLTTTAVLLLVYLGYLALRQMADSPAAGPAGRRCWGWSGSWTCRSSTCRWCGGARCTRRPPCYGLAPRRSLAACSPRSWSPWPPSPWPGPT